ncbi:MAG: UbiA-like polyprenyltransferase [Armatimonadota bacterium]
MDRVADRPGKLRAMMNLVRFEHTVFALPFALMAAFVRAGGWPTGRQLGFVLVCMVTARAAAMAFNRIVDVELDARNPRTAQRELPTGKVGMWEAQALTVASAGMFVLAARALNELCFLLSPLALAVILGYSYTKRFTAWSHALLGLSLAIAPMGGWLAVSGAFELPPFCLALAVVLWVAGFDIIYATLDLEFDEREGLHSAVRRYGLAGGLRLSAALHAAFLAALVAFGVAADLGPAYFVGALLAGGLVIAEHVMVSPRDLRRVNTAFFALNGVISVGLLAATAVDVWVG